MLRFLLVLRGANARAGEKSLSTSIQTPVLITIALDFMAAMRQGRSGSGAARAKPASATNTDHAPIPPAS